MDKEHILLKLVLDRIGFGNIEIDTFEKRLILQKKIYLLQLTGTDLGYRYNWYLQGPYCPALANDTFNLREEIRYDDEFNDYELNMKTQNRFEILNKIIGMPDTPTIRESEWVELLASLHYLKHIAYWPGKCKPEFDEIFEKLKESKPHFADKMALAKDGWERLNNIGLITSKTLES